MHEYLRRLILAHELGLVPRGVLSEATIAHDSWCGIYHGRLCQCDPDIRLDRDGKTVRIDRNGRVLGSPQDN